MSPEKILMLFVLGTCILPAISKQFVFVNEANTFDDAQTYCRRFHVDLASVEDTEDFSRLQAAVSGITEPSAWIGLKQANPDWLWSLSDSAFYGEGEAEYRNWKAGQLDNSGGNENCAAVDDAGEFWDIACANRLTFICYDGQQGIPRYVFVSQMLTWIEARTFCREKHTDLISVRNLEENNLVQALVHKGSLVYIGLYKDFYKWSDNSRSLFRHWSTDEPNYSGGCVELRLSDANTWADQNCGKTKPFICQDGVKMQILRVKLKSGHSVIDPVMKVSLIEEIQQKLMSLGMPADAKLQWRVQSDGEIFHPMKNDMNSHK